MSWAWSLVLAVLLAIAFSALNHLRRIADGMDAMAEMAKLLTKQARKDDERKAGRP
jgi:hypothetical protein